MHFCNTSLLALASCIIGIRNRIFVKGLSTVEDFLSQPPANHQAMLLLIIQMICSYSTQRVSQVVNLSNEHCLYHYSEDPAGGRCFENTQSSLKIQYPMGSARRSCGGTIYIIIITVVWSLTCFIGLRLTGDPGSLDC